MHIAIRVDASIHIGTGHLMRCLTLAEALRSKGAEVVFVCREHPGHLCEMVAKKCFEVITLEAGLNNDPCQADVPVLAHAHWLWTSQSADAEQTIQALKNSAPWNWLIVDHYALDYRWEIAMRAVADKIMAIDDLGDRKHDCDLLLDQNYFQDPAKRYKALLPEHCETLLGPRLALLRPEFRQARKFCRTRGNGAARVLLYFGGNDQNNLTGKALKALCDKSLRHLLVDAVIGLNNQYQEELEKQIEQRPGTRLHVQPEHFTELMLRADLCIGAGGTTTWERLCLGLPSLVITVSANQDPFTAELHQDGLITWVGREQDVSEVDIKNCVQTAIDKSQTDAFFSDALRPVDGLGVMRVAEKLIPTSRDDLSLRQANQEDIELFYFWANDPLVRQNSFNQKPIAWDEHTYWFKAKLESSLCQIWVMQTSSGLPIGQVRFDIDKKVANISYSLDPIARKRGWGVKLVQLGIEKISTLTNINIIQGKVKYDNHGSSKIFNQLGFIEISKGNIITFNRFVCKKS